MGPTGGRARRCLLLDRAGNDASAAAADGDDGPDDDDEWLAVISSVIPHRTEIERDPGARQRAGSNRALPVPSSNSRSQTHSRPTDWLLLLLLLLLPLGARHLALDSRNVSQWLRGEWRTVRSFIGRRSNGSAHQSDAPGLIENLHHTSIARWRSQAIRIVRCAAAHKTSQSVGLNEWMNAIGLQCERYSQLSPPHTIVRI